MSNTDDFVDQFDKRLHNSAATTQLFSTQEVRSSNDNVNLLAWTKVTLLCGGHEWELLGSMLTARCNRERFSAILQDPTRARKNITGESHSIVMGLDNMSPYAIDTLFAYWHDYTHKVTVKSPIGVFNSVTTPVRAPSSYTAYHLLRDMCKVATFFGDTWATRAVYSRFIDLAMLPAYGKSGLARVTGEFFSQNEEDAQRDHVFLRVLAATSKKHAGDERFRGFVMVLLRKNHRFARYLGELCLKI